MQFHNLFLIITNPCFVSGHSLGTGSGPVPSPNSGPGPGPGPWAWSWSRHISGPSLGPGPSQSFWSRHTVALVQFDSASYNGYCQNKELS